MQLSLLKLEVHFADETCHRKSFLLTRHILTMFHGSFERRTLTGVFLLCGIFASTETQNLKTSRSVT